VFLWTRKYFYIETAMTRILLVEDEERVRALLKGVLDSNGYEVQEASSGKEALQSYALSPPDLILTDLVMPDMEGIELITKIRKSDPNLKIIAMSGSNYLYIAERLGVDGILAKPFSNKALLNAVKATLG
jgi:CheY-like chemotaxis protein